MRPSNIDLLTDREKEVLRLLARGFDVKSSAQKLDVSANVINERLREARRKVGASNSRQAARQLALFEGDPKNFGDKFPGVATETPFRPSLVLPDQQAGAGDTATATVGEAQAVYHAWADPFGKLPYLPLRQPGERGNALSRKQRLISIVELSIRLSAIIAIICLVALLLDRLVQVR